MLSSPALAATTAIWLLLAPVLGLQSGPRSTIGVAVGVAALLLAPLGMWTRGARAALGALGLALALVNLVLPGSIGSLADFATCAAALMIAGGLPAPEVAALAIPVARTVPQERALDEDETPTRRLPHAA